MSNVTSDLTHFTLFTVHTLILSPLITTLDIYLSTVLTLYTHNMCRIYKKSVIFLLFAVFLSCQQQVLGRSVDDHSDDLVVQEGEDDAPAESHRSSRLFPLFPWSMPKSSGSNTGCGVGSTTGTCQSSKYCKLKGGKNTNAVCEGNNVCCQITTKCASDAETCTIRESGSLIINEESTMVPYQRHYVFPRIKGACQLKLELTTFELSQPTSGNCALDMMTISGSPTVKQFRICGSQKDQTLYLDYGTSENIKVNMNIKRMGSQYVIRPTFIRCDSSKRAPAHCLQYFTQQTGVVKSFNFDEEVHLNNLEYTVCVKSSDENSQIQWRECNANVGGSSNFFVSGNKVNDVGAVSDAEKCDGDFVEIFGGGRHCGTSFPPSVTSNAKPFLLNVHFDASEILPLPIPNPPPYTNCTSPAPEFTCEPEIENGMIISCQCRYKDMTIPQTTELSNTGFCLEYNQL